MEQCQSQNMKEPVRFLRGRVPSCYFLIGPRDGKARKQEAAVEILLSVPTHKFGLLIKLITQNAPHPPRLSLWGDLTEMLGTWDTFPGGQIVGWCDNFYGGASA
jgi:hypothetical protein